MSPQAKLRMAKTTRQGAVLRAALTMVASLALPLAGCFDATYPCTTDDSCVHGGVGGFCRVAATGSFCMFPDSSCEKKLRWDKSASSDVAGTCFNPTCNDGVKNGVPGDDAESDVDCGGTCAGCATGLACAKNTDCASNHCVNDRCVAPTCFDNILNGNETSKGDSTSNDCGGGTCEPCGAGRNCRVASDCLTGLDCIRSSCSKPACDDGLFNGAEVTTDCGGPGCPPCLPSQTCKTNEDCSTGICDAKTSKCSAIAWDAVQSFVAGKKPGMTVITDVDDDGNVDLVVNDESTVMAKAANGVGLIEVNQVQVIRGNGDGTFRSSSPSTFATNTQSRAIVAADLDDDGAPDFMFHSPPQAVGVWEASPLLNDWANQQSLSLWPILDGARGIDRRSLFIGISYGAVADYFNNDSIPDVALLVGDANSASISLITGNSFRLFGGVRSITAAPLYPPNTDPDPPIDSRLVSADFNNDGFPDLAYGAAVGANAGVVWLLNDKQGNFTFGKHFALGERVVNALAVGDFNDDHLPDVVGIATRLEFTKDGLTNAQPHSVIVALNDADHSFGTVRFARGVAPGSLNAPQYLNLAVADMNGDGKLDVVVNTASSSMQILYGNGRGDLVRGTEASIKETFNLYHLTVGDLNNDGKPDVVSTNGNKSASAYVWLHPARLP